MVAVVGSTGKTSTKDALGALCAAVTPTVFAEASQNNEIGLPLTVLRLEPDTDVLVTEMGMRGHGQIAELCAIARPTIALVTSIGPEHLELVGTVEDVARANAEAIDALPAGGIAVVPVDAPELEPYLGRAPVEVRRFDPETVTRGDDGRWASTSTGWQLQPRASARAAPPGRERPRRAHRLPRARAPARAGAGGRSAASSRHPGAERHWRCPAAASSSTTPTTRTRRR